MPASIHCSTSAPSRSPPARHSKRVADLTLKERLQPSLLDRLTDRDPQSRLESRDRRVLSVEKVRESVIRDLSWLLNTGALQACQDLEEFPEVRRSVLNYGAPDLAGVTASGSRRADLEAALKDCIATYEPRILEGSLRVTIESGDGHALPGTLQLSIEGQLWAQPMPVSLYLRTELDLQSGACRVTERLR